ncbi:hypothetical protein QBC46DRAFT_421698 [Diplogelasinospora grovesii]|uniref:3-carboxymuconate cyclase n=1 Tax=Diplogelasinospora grovesii TaxID=303347 RepID=A0AAN6RZJ1_9PEZI|nr:hypothetical protein QBC46DRAFT_421698 [Diplogelasinospora grovesii]
MQKAASGNAKALYITTNNQENTVCAVEIGQDGLITGKGAALKTGGAGANGVDGTTNGTAAPDALFSQSALTIAGENIFVVNAGSNSLSMMAIDPKDPLSLKMVGQPVSLPGEFPNTVAASRKNKLVCVGMTGKKAGVSCCSFDAKKGLGQMDGLREIDLGQTTPPVGPTNTMSQVFFSSDETQLYATVKGDPAQKKNGFFSVYTVQKGQKEASVSQQDVRSSPAGTAVLFGSAVIPGSSDVFVTDASFGAALLGLDAKSNAAAVKGKASVDGQKATCWATISPATNTAFVTDVGKNRLVEVSFTDKFQIVGVVDLSSANQDPGLIDLKAGGDFIYALSPGNGSTECGISVVDAKSKKLVQHAGLEGVGAGKNSMGMALLQ